MASKKTSRKRARSSSHERLSRGLKPGIRTIPYDPVTKMADTGSIARAVAACLMKGDIDGALSLVITHLEARNIVEALKVVKLSRRTYYQAKTSKNPTIKTFGKMIKAAFPVS